MNKPTNVAYNVRQMSKNRRLAAICGGATAAVAGLPVLLHSSSHDSAVSGAVGFVCGLLVTISVGLFVKHRVLSNRA